MGATDVIKSVLDELELDGEGDTADKMATFKFNTCLGACPQAPVMSINHRMYGKVSAKQAKTYLGNARVIWTNGDNVAPAPRDNQPKAEPAAVKPEDLPF